jgi:hypothetical protein
MVGRGFHFFLVSPVVFFVSLFYTMPTKMLNTSIGVTY